jgi:hypothetical protein
MREPLGPRGRASERAGQPRLRWYTILIPLAAGVSDVRSLICLFLRTGEVARRACRCGSYFYVDRDLPTGRDFCQTGDWRAASPP